MKCSRQRCTRPARIEGLCRSHATKEADRLWSEAVRARDGRCLGAEHFPGIECWGVLQAHHLARKGTYPAGRHRLEIGATLCIAHHKYVTEHQLENEDLASAILGADRWAEVRAAARGDVPHLGDVLTKLRTEAP